MMDLGFLIDHIMASIKPLRWDDVIRSNVPLKVSPSPILLRPFLPPPPLLRGH